MRADDRDLRLHGRRGLRIALGEAHLVLVLHRLHRIEGRPARDSGHLGLTEPNVAGSSEGEKSLVPSGSGGFSLFRTARTGP